MAAADVRRAVAPGARSGGPGPDPQIATGLSAEGAGRVIGRPRSGRANASSGVATANGPDLEHVLGPEARLNAAGRAAAMRVRRAATRGAAVPAEADAGPAAANGARAATRGARGAGKPGRETGIREAMGVATTLGAPAPTTGAGRAPLLAANARGLPERLATAAGRHGTDSVVISTRARTSAARTTARTGTAAARTTATAEGPGIARADRAALRTAPRAGGTTPASAPAARADRAGPVPTGAVRDATGATVRGARAIGGSRVRHGTSGAVETRSASRCTPAWSRDPTNRKPRRTSTWNCSRAASRRNCAV